MHARVALSARADATIDVARGAGGLDGGYYVRVALSVLTHACTSCALCSRRCDDRCGKGRWRSGRWILCASSSLGTYPCMHELRSLLAQMRRSMWQGALA